MNYPATQNSIYIECSPYILQNQLYGNVFPFLIMNILSHFKDTFEVSSSQNKTIFYCLLQKLPTQKINLPRGKTIILLQLPRPNFQSQITPRHSTFAVMLKVHTLMWAPLTAQNLKSVASEILIPMTGVSQLCFRAPLIK